MHPQLIPQFSFDCSSFLNLFRENIDFLHTEEFAKKFDDELVNVSSMMMEVCSNRIRLGKEQWRGEWLLVGYGSGKNFYDEWSVLYLCVGRGDKTLVEIPIDTCFVESVDFIPDGKYTKLVFHYKDEKYRDMGEDELRELRDKTYMRFLRESEDRFQEEAAENPDKRELESEKITDMHFSLYLPKETAKKEKGWFGVLAVRNRDFLLTRHRVLGKFQTAGFLPLVFLQ